MLLTKLIQGLGALSLAHLAFAVEEPLWRRTNETGNTEEGNQVDSNGDYYTPECWNCWKTKTVTCTEIKTTTCL
jgi:hypothetical protein